MREVYWAVSRRLLLLFLFVLVAAALLFVPLPSSTTYAGRVLENAGHTPLFVVGALIILSVLRNDFRIEGARLYALAGLIGVGAGFLSEVIQKPLHRDASWEDVFADTVGVLLGLALYALFDRRTNFRRVTRAAAALIVVGCAVYYFEPIVTMVHAYIYRNSQFPVLARFDSQTESLWIVGYGVKREIRDGALDIEFEASPFPGFSFHEPVPDWTDYRTLVVDVENPGDAVLFLALRVHDLGHARGGFADRFNRRFELKAGERKVLRISLDEVQHGPRNRLMNMAQISDVTLFRGKDSGSKLLRLHSMWLE